MEVLESKVQELREVAGDVLDTGWMHDEVCWLLYGLVRFYRPSLVIQTGHLWGKSALYVLRALRDADLQPVEMMGDPAYAQFVQDNAPPRVLGRMISVDPQPRGPQPLADWYPNFELRRQASKDFFAEFEGKSERLFGIVDGDHTEEGALADLKALAKLDAGMILLDDTSWLPELRDAGHSIGYSVSEFPEYNGVMLLTRTP